MTLREPSWGAGDVLRVHLLAGRDLALCLLPTCPHHLTRAKRGFLFGTL